MLAIQEKLVRAAAATNGGRQNAAVRKTHDASK